MTTLEQLQNSGLSVMEQAEEIKNTLLSEEEAELERIQPLEDAYLARIRHRFGTENVGAVEVEDVIDTRVTKELLIEPRVLAAAVPLTNRALETTRQGRTVGRRILNGLDDRLMAFVRPCSVHDVDEFLEYQREYILPWRREFEEDLEVASGFYDEKPRSGPKKGEPENWKGLAVDPKLDGSDDINLGVVLSRLGMMSMAEMGIPNGKELMSPIITQYVNGLVTVNVTGARGITDPRNRETMSGMSSLTGHKNPLDGNLEIAVAAAAGVERSQSFPGIGQNGRGYMLRATGHKDHFVILRGSDKAPNYDHEHINELKTLLGAYGLRESIGIDFSHQNSRKVASNQVHVAHAVSEQVASGETAITSFWVESYLKHGAQTFKVGMSKSNIEEGLSISDECAGPEETYSILQIMASSVRLRRKVLGTV
jgi:3-deoxy-7-phosphoheptulonate synthase